jgi:hypothetical protein
VIGEQPADQRAQHGCDAEYRAECALVLATLTQRDDIGDHRGRGHREAARPDSLHRTPGNQPAHVLGETAGRRCDHEDAGRELEDQLASEQVAELSGEHRGDGVGQQIGRHDPAQMSGTAQVTDDGRQRGGHDRLVQRREQHAEQHGDEDQVHPPTIHLRWGLR